MSTPDEIEDDARVDISKLMYIRALNDEFRTQALLGFALGDNKLVITRGVVYHDLDLIDRAVKAVRTFCDFTSDNDPYGEHDFGAFSIDGVPLNWKIDYYDNKLEFGSPDPADPAVTRRVLTIMLADEY